MEQFYDFILILMYLIICLTGQAVLLASCLQASSLSISVWKITDMDDQYMFQSSLPNVR